MILLNLTKIRTMDSYRKSYVWNAVCKQAKFILKTFASVIDFQFYKIDVFAPSAHHLLVKFHLFKF